MRFALRVAVWVALIGTALVWIRALRCRWRQLYPAGALPSRRWQHRAIYDVAANQMVVYAGKSNETGPDVNFNDVWILHHADNTGGSPTWVQAHAGGVAPLARHMHSAVYDPTSRAMTIFGGHLDVVGQFGNDVWVLTNAVGPGTPTWTQLFPTGIPPSRREWHSAIYDPGSNRMVIFGGTAPGDNNVWILEHANGAGGTPAWLKITPPAPAPSPRRGHSAVYDAASNRMIVFGGEQYGAGGFTCDVWVLSHANGLGGTPAWTQISASGVPPFPRSDHTAVYDPLENGMVVFGGWSFSGSSTYFNDAWVLTHANGLGGFPAWKALTPLLTAPPEHRELHSAVYNPSSKRMIVFGGAVADEAMRNDVWLLLNATGH